MQVRHTWSLLLSRRAPDSGVSGGRFRAATFNAVLMAMLLPAEAGLALEPAPRLPVEAFFEKPRLSSPRLSPDGNHIAFLFSQDDLQLIMVRESAGGELKPLGKIEEKGVRLSWLEWANTDRLLVSIQMRYTQAIGVRARATRMAGVDRRGGGIDFLGKKWRRVGQGAYEVQFQDQVLHWLPDDADHVLIEYRGPGARSPSVMRMNVNSGKLRGHTRRHAGIHEWRADPDGNIRIGIGHPGQRYVLYGRAGAKGSFKTLQDFDLYEEQGFRQWGQAMQDDIADGVRWLISEGIADPERVGIFGASYGGYAALMGAVRSPDLFRAVASYAGVVDLSMLIADSKFYAFSDQNTPRIGGGWGDRGRLHANSPLRHATQIQVPVLLAHGENDERVHVRHSRAMASALRKAGSPVEYLEFEKEIHGFLLEANQLRFYEALGAFFEDHLAAGPPSTDSRQGRARSGVGSRLHRR